MLCPACNGTMTPREVEGITFDVCTNGCAGLFFDWHELERVDEPDEAAGEVLLEVQPVAEVVVDRGGLRQCPRCQNPMVRHFTSVKRGVEADECPSCAGYFLDAGELRNIRSEYSSDDERRGAAQAYFSDLFDAELAEARADEDESRAQMKKVAHALRFVCPSYYLPGKQDWGAF